MGRKVKTAVVGLGTIGPVHAEWYSQVPESTLAAVCDVRGKVVRHFSEKYDVKGYTDYRDLLENKEVEAVTVCPPNFLHAEVAIEAAKSGKHVAVEKPLSISLRQADRMIAAVKRAKVRGMYLENLCFAPSFSMAREIIERGGLGNVYYCRAVESGDVGIGTEEEREAVAKSWYLDLKKAGGGMLMGTGCHAIQYVRYVFGNEQPTRVNAEIIDSIGLRKPKGIEDVGLVTMRFRGDRIGEAFTSYYATGGGCDDRAEIYGDMGTAFLDLYRRNPIVVHSKRGYGMIGHSMFNSHPGDDGGWSFPIPEEHYSLGYYHEQRHFLRSIINDTRPRLTLEDGRSTLEIVLAAYESHRRGMPVTLPLS